LHHVYGPNWAPTPKNRKGRPTQPQGNRKHRGNEINRKLPCTCRREKGGREVSMQAPKVWSKTESPELEGKAT